MKIVSWNVAGFRACLKKGFEDFFYKEDADIYCLQESKLLESDLTFKPDGYEYYLYPAIRKGYSGTLIYSKVKPLSVTYGIGEANYDDEGRIITLEFDNFYLINAYVPNVKRDLSRLDDRMHFQDIFKKYLKDLEKTKPVVVCGDFNVAHEEIDIKNAKANIGNAGFTYEEREKMTDLLSSGFIDTFRYFNPTEIKYTWWSYMFNARANDVGWRIDYFVVSKDFINNVSAPMIYTDVMGSDHCPIGLEVK